MKKHTVNKNMIHKYRIFNTAQGWSGIVTTAQGVAALFLPDRTRNAIEEQLGVYAAEEADDVLSEMLEADLRDFFAGCLRPEKRGFDYPLDLSSSSDFQKKVYAAARSIPYGCTRSYKWVAEQIGCPKGQQAVGQAMKANPVPIIIPCHRVVGSGGKLGGFSGGLDKKLILLRLEGMDY